MVDSSVDVWGEEPQIPNSRAKKYSRMVDDWRVSPTPTDHFRSVEYMRDLREWKEKHDAWLEKVKIIYEKTDKENCDLLYKMLTAQQKLEAVKKWHYAQLGNEVDPQDIYELSKILEAET